MLLAGLWGLIAGSALVLGALVGFHFKVSARIIAGIMAFGGGVLISALSFDLMDEAYKRGGFDSTALGFLAGATIYTVANWLLSRAGAKHRKRSGHHTQQPSEQEQSGSGMAIAVGQRCGRWWMWAPTLANGLACCGVSLGQITTF